MFNSSKQAWFVLKGRVKADIAEELSNFFICYLKGWSRGAVG